MTSPKIHTPGDIVDEFKDSLSGQQHCSSSSSSLTRCKPEMQHSLQIYRHTYDQSLMNLIERLKSPLMHNVPKAEQSLTREAWVSVQCSQAEKASTCGSRKSNTTWQVCFRKCVEPCRLQWSHKTWSKQQRLVSSSSYWPSRMVRVSTS